MLQPQNQMLQLSNGSQLQMPKPSFGNAGIMGEKSAGPPVSGLNPLEPMNPSTMSNHNLQNLNNNELTLGSNPQSKFGGDIVEADSSITKRPKKKKKKKVKKAGAGGQLEEDAKLHDQMKALEDKLEVESSKDSDPGFTMLGGA
mmetsp:Transcript_5841/g.9367  ORF Transcript_5841/g.9367 Transcript_5841/m.9367 type:complete len:144 (+) Transcript_5841:2065-2496(+)